MTDSLNEKIKKLVTKYNSIQGSLLSMGKRLTALEEKKESKEFEGDKELLFRIADYLGDSIKPPAEVIADVAPPKVGPEKEEVEEEEETEEEIDPETLDALDEIIEAE